MNDDIVSEAHLVEEPVSAPVKPMMLKSCVFCLKLDNENHVNLLDDGQLLISIHSLCVAALIEAASDKLRD